MADQDYEEVAGLSRSINNRPGYAASSSLRYETRASKRARTNGGSILLTPHSVAVSTPSQETESSRLLSAIFSVPIGALEAAMPPPSTPSTTLLSVEELSASRVDSRSSSLSSIFDPKSGKQVDYPRSDAVVSDSPGSSTDVQPPAPELGCRHSLKKQEDGQDVSLNNDILNNLEETTPSEKPKKSSATRKRKAVERRKLEEEGDASLEAVVQATANENKSNSAGRKKAVPRKTPVKYYGSSQDGKPEPHGHPTLWANKRQQLCETLPYFKAYEGGTYQNHGIVYGFLIDKEVGIRDKFDDEVVITSVGGSRSTDEDGNKGLKQDQPYNKAEPFISAMQRKLPIAIIAGQGNPLSPSKLPHVYNVLDWFHVTDVWSEISGSKGFKAWRVRFEKINLTEKSWWAVRDSPGSPQGSPFDAPKADVETCTTCGISSKTIYNVGWACLQRECESFFKFGNGADIFMLDYDDTFMKERTAYTGAPPGPLSPPLPTEDTMAELEAYGFEKALKCGIVCPKCGCCSRRIVWDHWYCENSDCDFTYALSQKKISPTDVISKAMEYFEADKKTNSVSSMLLQMDKETVLGGVLRTHNFHGPWNINRYAIPGEAGEIIGFVKHFKSNGIINQQKGGPNDMFEEMQTGEFGLRRNPARQPGAVGEVLTSHFATNFGAPYKFGVKQVSKGFDQAPDVILKTIKRLSWAGQIATTDQGKAFRPFNECLAVGYFEGSVINYHDDGEKTLGPTVATLSLGAPAKMFFRPKAKGPVGKLNGRKTKAPVLELTLRHGDIIIMDGEKIQKFYEHAVTPFGFRYALTCRYIIGEKMDTEEERRAAVLEGALPPESERFTYDGDLDATELGYSTSEAEKIMNMITAKMTTGCLTVSQVSELKEELAALLASPPINTEQVITDILPDMIC